MTQPMKIYVAAHATTPNREAVVASLYELGHQVYDPVRPLTVAQLGECTKPDDHTIERFEWPTQYQSPREVRDTLNEPSLVQSYQADLEALRWCDFVLVLGGSDEVSDGGLLAAGMGAGLGKRVFVYMPDGGVCDEWLAMFDEVLVSESELEGLFPELAKEKASATELKDRLMSDGDDYE